ncbi:MAG: hypothetical protein UY41_C0006G0004 [Candidatus Moranbacteria bacterium GW2011_GWE1_49_15]|nr:MAG: hypothetical protein UX75_C0014G0008 [Candidatus Moranbacteria bacterium GW2011_GWE2_47_10]KKW07294.1 MAG: hypothetical protein UY41_C0006G0004 [Candidatus Moranbacteria bacterium GW2011_GWE1_49_15]HBP00639.1 hypothetical protein [Candidatus Moranbacteria bacterium]
MKKSLFIVLFFLSAAIIAGFFAISQRRTHPADAGFANHEKGGGSEMPERDDVARKDWGYDFSLKKIFLEGEEQEYGIEKGNVFKDGQILEAGSPERERVLRLFSFYKWLAEDPLLFYPEMEAGPLEDTLRGLEEEHGKLMLSIKEDDSIYPFDFLRSFMDSSKAFAVFSEKISFENAEEMLGAMKKTRDDYENDVKSLKAAFERQKGTEVSGKKIAYSGGKSYSDLETMISDVNTMLRNADILKEELEKREKCLKMSASFCEGPWEAAKEPADTFHIRQVGEIKAGDIIRGDGRELKEGRGPYLVSSRCWGGEEEWLEIRKKCGYSNGLCEETDDLALKSFFSRPGTRDPLEKRMAESGVELIPQVGTVPYGCNDLEYKQAVWTMDGFIGRYGNEKIFKKILEEGSWSGMDEISILAEKGSEFEEPFLKAERYSEKDLAILGAWYGYFYGKAASADVMSGEEAAEFLERAVFIKSKMASLHKSFRRTYALLKKFNSSPIPLHEDFQPLYAYASRSNYSLFFLNFSPVVWRSFEKPAYIIKGNMRRENSTDSVDYILDSDEAIGLYGKEKITEWIGIYEEAKKAEK